MTEESGTRTSVGLLDIAGQMPGLIRDAPTILRGFATGFLARPSAKTSIGKVFQERAARYADKPFLKFEGREITYGEANETVNRYAAAEFCVFDFFVFRTGFSFQRRWTHQNCSGE